MVVGMAEFVTKQNIINFIARIISLSALSFTWIDISGLKQYAAIVYVYRNKITCILGLIIIFVELFLKIDWKYKSGLNLSGNMIFWIPLFYAALNETDNISYVTVMFYISVAIVFFCCVLQLKIIHTSKSSTV